MKKVIGILIMLISLLALSSCGTVPTDTNTPNTSIQPTPSLIESAAETAVIPSPTDTASVTALSTETAIISTTTATPSITPTPTVNPIPMKIELDFMNDKFDRVEVFSDGNFIDITEYWSSFQKFISASWLIGYKPATNSLPTEPHDESDYCFRFIKDNEVFYATTSNLSHNSFGGFDVFYVLHNDVLYEYCLSNIALFHRAFAPAQEAEGLLSNNAILLEPSVYDIMSDSVLLIRKMTNTDDIYYWGQEKYTIISAIANHYTESLEQKPDDLKMYGIIYIPQMLKLK